MDEIDERILYYLQHGRTNSYQVWKSIDVESNGNGLAYVNIYKRLNHLFDSGIIERIKISGENLHGGKHYGVTKKGKQTVREHIKKLEEILK